MEHKVVMDDTKCTLYSSYVKACKDRLDMPAVFINESKELFTSGEILSFADAASAGLSSIGLGLGTRVGIMLNATVEEAVVLLALSKIGAVCKYIDFMKSPMAIKDNIVSSKLDYLVVDIDSFDVGPFSDDESFPPVIAITGKETLNERFKNWKDIIKAENIAIEATPYINDKAAVVINSSGTTGAPKPIVHTDLSINSAVRKMEDTDFPIESGNVIIKNIPSCVGLGLITSLYTGLITGSVVVLMKARDINGVIDELSDFVENFASFKNECGLNPDAKLNIFSTPLFIGGMIQSEKTTDLSCIGSMLAAGSKMTKESLEVLNGVAKQKGCAVPICNGYGQNEMAGAVALNCNCANRNGSAGIPTVGTEVIVVDLDNHKKISNNEIGLVLEKSDSCFKEYENMPELTSKAWTKLDDGTMWFNTNDLGYFDNDGYLNITGRLSRVAIRADFKISLDEIERKLKKIDCIEDCAVIVPKAGGSMEEIIAFVKTEETTEEIMEHINKSNLFSEFDMPSRFVSIAEIPYRGVGKVDYMALEKEANSSR